MFQGKIGGLTTWATPIAFFAVLGCAHQPPIQQDYAYTESVVVEAPFGPAWQAVKTALVDLDYSIYTRDKRGLFVAHGKRGRKWIVPRRTQMTVTLDSVTAQKTRVTVEALRQRYRVTPLTYPDWREIAPVDEVMRANELLDAIVDGLDSGST